MTIEPQALVVGDLTFQVRVGGPADGTAVLLLHGFPNTGTCFDSVVKRLHESGLRTVVPDQRGYSPGARPAAVDDYRIDKLAADAIGILDALAMSTAMVVGHDWGALVAWQVAARNPDRITALVAASVGHPSAMADALAADTDQRARSAYILDFVADGAEDKLLADDAQALLAAVPDDSVQPLTERAALTAALNWYRANFTGNVAETMACPPVEVQTTVLWGTDDPALGREQASGSGRYVYGEYRFCELAGVDHWIPQNAAAALASEIALRSAAF